MAVDIPVAGTSDGTTGTGDLQLMLGAPSGITNGDLLLQVGACADVRTLTSTLTEIELHTLNGARNYVFAKKAASESGDYPIDISGTFAGASAIMLRITGALCDNLATDIIIETGGNGTSDQTSECPNVTTPVANCMVLWVELAGGNQTATSNNRGSAVEVIDFAGGGAGDAGHISVWKEDIASAGAVTGAIITRTSFGGNQTFGIVLQPSGAAAEQRTITIAGAAVVTFSNQYKFRSAVSASGTGAYNATSRYLFRAALSSAGIAASSIVSRFRFLSAMASAGLGAFNSSARYLFRSVLSATGLGAFNPTTTEATVIQRTFSAAGTAVASFVQIVRHRVSFSSSSTSSASFQTESGTPSRSIIAKVSLSDRVMRVKLKR